jgi:uncharacterized oligopeptide transporter (OPT) family protein
MVIEHLNLKSKGKFPISAMGLGLAFVLHFTDSIAMATGSVLFWYFNKRFQDQKSLGHRVFVANAETLCAGVIAGGSIIGIVLILLENVVFAK